LRRYVGAVQVAFVIGFGLFTVSNAQLRAQLQPATAAASPDSIPEAPQPQRPSAEQSSTNAEPAATAMLSGTVMDTNGGVVEGARVAVRSNSGAEAHILQTGADGQFTFSGLPAGRYKLTVSVQGMSTYASPEIDLKPGAVRILPQITLTVQAATASVTVTGNNQELAEEQVQIATQQRVLGVLPNFYTSFDRNAPPMMAKQKFKLSVHSMFDPTAFVIMAGVAGAEQYRNVYPGFGGGWEGYGKRYGATFANHVSDQFFARALYPSIFHQDPRYFYKGEGSFKSRAWYAVSNVVIARGDDGRWKPNYSSVLGKLSSGALSNLYYPESERGANLVFFNTFTELAADAAENLIKEFILKGITSHVPRDVSGGN
jgi:Carboxypeptidase regulatory-like domain